MSNDVKWKRGQQDGRGLRIGVVTALFNRDVTELLEAGAHKALSEAGVSPEDVIAVQVPGAFEIPLVVKALIQHKAVDGVVALGAVIRGETSHYDYVCSAVERGCTQVALDTGKPVGFGILTTENTDQAMARAGGSQGNKGHETACVVLEICNLLKMLQKRD